MSLSMKGEANMVNGGMVGKKTNMEVSRAWIVLECKSPDGFIRKVHVPAGICRNESVVRYKMFKMALKAVSFSALKLMAGVMAGLLTAAWIIPAVNEARGYEAVGSEWLIIYIAIFAGIYVADKALRKIGRR